MKKKLFFCSFLWVFLLAVVCVWFFFEKNHESNKSAKQQITNGDHPYWVIIKSNHMTSIGKAFWLLVHDLYIKLQRNSIFAFLIIWNEMSNQLFYSKYRFYYNLWLNEENTYHPVWYKLIKKQKQGTALNWPEYISLCVYINYSRSLSRKKCIFDI